MRLEFTGQSARDALNPGAHSARLVNLYREPLVPGGKSGFQLRAVLGMEAVADLGRVWMRAMAEFDGDLLAVCGGRLFRVTVGGDVTEIGEVGDSPDTSIATNNGVATIAAGGAYWIYDGTTLTAGPMGALSAVSSVAYLSGYTVLAERGGRRLQWSALANPASMPGLNVASAEFNDDEILRIVTLRDVLLVFKRSGFEQWGLTGAANANAFARISGAMEEIGLSSERLLTTYQGGMAFVSSTGKVFAWAGGFAVISTPPVEVALTEKQPERLFYYTHRGHEFICLTFRDCPAWCYDIALGEWHERAEMGGPWTARDSVQVGEQWFIGTDTGRIARLVGRCRDFGEPMVRRAVSGPFPMDRPTRVAKLALFPRVGMDRQTDYSGAMAGGGGTPTSGGVYPLGEPGPDGGRARVALSVSHDCITFGADRWLDVGHPGAYRTWVEFRNLGLFRRQAAFQVMLSSDMDIPLLSVADLVAA